MSSGYAYNEIMTALVVTKESQVLTSSNHELHIHIHVTDDGLHTNMQTGLSGIGSYYIDGSSFLQNLVSTSLHLKRILQSPHNCVPPTLELQCRKIGDHDQVMQYVATLTAGDSTLDVKESTISRPAEFPGLVCKFSQFPAGASVKEEMAKIALQVHLTHLINPQMTFVLRVSGLRRSSFSVKYNHGLQLKIPNISFSLAAPLWHYCNTDDAKHTKLKLLKGTSYFISDYQPVEGHSYNVKLSCCAALSPHMRLNKNKKIPADRVCDSVQISVFGPGSAPLLNASSHCNMPPTCLVEWDNYKITPMPTLSRTTTMDESSCYVPNFAFELKKDIQRKAGSKYVSNRVLHIFIFLEYCNSSTSIHKQWNDITLLRADLRENFSKFVITYCKKFHKATQSALDKLLWNYKAQSKISSLVSTCIPLLSESISSIIEHSNNRHFVQECLHLMQVSAVDIVCSKIKEHLWSLAADTSIVSSTEPATPELKAASEAFTSSKNQGTKRMVSPEESTTHDVSPLRCHNVVKSHLYAQSRITASKQMRMADADVSQDEDHFSDLLSSQSPSAAEVNFPSQSHQFPLHSIVISHASNSYVHQNSETCADIDLTNMEEESVMDYDNSNAVGKAVLRDSSDEHEDDFDSLEFESSSLKLFDKECTSPITVQTDSNSSFDELIKFSFDEILDQGHYCTPGGIKHSARKTLKEYAVHTSGDTDFNRISAVEN